MSSDPRSRGPSQNRGGGAPGGGGAGGGRGRGRRGGNRGGGRGGNDRRDPGGRAGESQREQVKSTSGNGRRQPRQDLYQQSHNSQSSQVTGRGRSGRGRNARSPKPLPQEPNTSPLLSAAAACQPPAKHQSSTKTANVVKPKNGEKGADVHTVSEVERIHFTKLLLAFREDGERDKLEFDSSLTNTERKFIHQLAGQLGLVSKSTGKGEDRKIAVTKRTANKKNMGSSYDDLPILKISPAGIDALHRHVTRFPPTRAEELESIDTGSSLVDAMHRDEEGDGRDGFNDAYDDAAVVESLNRLGLGMPKQAPISVPPVKHIDWNRRRGRHADFQRQKRSNPSRYQAMLNSRARLPAFARQAEIVAMVAANPVTIIQGETGCGKSTQCPQFLLDANPTANIAVTQPRRISAISIAERVAEEQCLGADQIGSLVGYQVRLESASSKDTQLLFLTPGVLLRKLQSSPMLAEYTHIVIDEVHERDRYTEFLMIRLRDLLPLRPELRLVLMSATLQTETLMSYFSNCDDPYYRRYPPVMLSIEGRTFPVQEFYLEHVLELTNHIDLAAFPDDDNNKGCATSGPPMSMDQLDAELSRLLMSNGASTITNANTPSSSTKVLFGDSDIVVRCAMCGKIFADPAELGEHVASCTGIPGDDGAIFPDDQEGTVIRLSIDSPPDVEGEAISDYTVSNEDFKDYEEYEEYDVEGTQDVADYQFQDLAEIPFTGPLEDTTVEKWDGEGMFHANVEQEPELTADQEKYLNLYQSMHDDEQIDTDLLLELLHYIHKSSYGEGAILVFLPGWQEISECSLLLKTTPPFSNSSKFSILPLHSGIPSSDQRKVLRRPPAGVRKIVLSTNIAETSLTIDDVAFVVDSGRAKEKDYDPHLKTSTLQPTWISQSSSKQRKGRAGRTKAGVCFHLFSSRRYGSLRPFVESELLRTPLEEMCLMTKKLGLAPGGPEDDDGIPAFLSKAITPPHEKSISNALELLVKLGAMLPETNDLTTLGECLSVLSLEPRVGKMVIWSYLLGCSRTASQMAVAMSSKSPFVLPPPAMRREAEKMQLALSNHSESDQATVLNAVVKTDQLKKSSDGVIREWCRKNYISYSTMQMISDLRNNLCRELSSLNFIDPMEGGSHNRYDSQEPIWQAAIAAGLYPNIATRKRGDVNFSTMTNQKAKIHVSSVNAIKGQPLNSKCQVAEGVVEFVCFGELTRGSHFFTMSQTTHLPSPLPILLLCGTSLRVKPVENSGGECGISVLDVDDWIFFKAPSNVAAMLVITRKRLESAFWSVLSQPKRGFDSLTSVEKDAIETMDTVLRSSPLNTGRSLSRQR